VELVTTSPFSFWSILPDAKHAAQDRRVVVRVVPHDVESRIGLPPFLDRVNLSLQHGRIQIS
jgi:hypothetical protein